MKEIQIAVAELKHGGGQNWTDTETLHDIESTTALTNCVNC